VNKKNLQSKNLKFKIIMNESCNTILTRTAETPQVVHTLGPEDSFSHYITKLLIERGDLPSNTKIKYGKSNSEVVQIVSNYARRYIDIAASNLPNAINFWCAGEIPVGNSKGGTVDQTLEAMHDNNNIVIVRQDSININQIGGLNPNAYLYEHNDNNVEVTTIATHKQAHLQTEQERIRINLKRVELGLSELKIIETESTTAGVELAKSDPCIMAIATKDAIKNNGLVLYNDGSPMSLPGNVTKFNLIRPGSLDPHKMLKLLEYHHIQIENLSGRDTIMLQVKLLNVQGSEYSLLKILADKYKLNIIAKNWRHNGLPNVPASEVIELNGLDVNNPENTRQLLLDLRKWENDSQGKISILGIYKSANIYSKDDRNALD
jgi:prephenate dehydratase